MKDAKRIQAVGKQFSRPADLAGQTTQSVSISGTKCPDAKDELLLDLRPVWLASIARLAKATAACDEIRDSVVSEHPNEMADLKIQKGDERYLRLRGRSVDGAHRYSKEEVESFRALLDHFPTGDGFYFSTGLGRQRGEAIVQAFDVVERAEKAAHARLGFEAAVNEFDAASAENAQLRELISRHRATTKAEFLFKAEVAGWCFGSPDEIESEHIEGDNTCDAVLFSILADLLRIAEAREVPIDLSRHMDAVAS